MALLSFPYITVVWPLASQDHNTLKASCKSQHHFPCTAKQTAAILCWHNVPFMSATFQTSFHGPSPYTSPLPLWMKMSVLLVGRSFSEQGSPGITVLVLIKTTFCSLVPMREMYHLSIRWCSDLYPPQVPNFSGKLGWLEYMIQSFLPNRTKVSKLPDSH